MSATKARVPMIILLKNRGEPQDEYEDVITSSGWSCCFVPLLQHAPTNMAELKSYLSSPSLDETHYLIVTSQRAVHSVQQAMDDLGADKREKLLEKPVYTVGPATCSVLQAVGFKDVRGAEVGNGRVLSRAILDEHDEFLKKRDSGDIKRFKFFTGQTRHDYLPDTLRATDGFDLNELVVYKTVPVLDTVKRLEEKLQANPERPWIVFFSPSHADEVVEHLRQKPRGSFLIGAIGPTTEAYLHQNGLTPDCVAHKPSAQGIFTAIRGAS